MHIGIVGAGFVGVCTALQLSLRGHRVEVFERRGGIATESSFAGAGVLCPTALPSLAQHPHWRRRSPWNAQARRQARARRQADWLARQQVLARLFELGEHWLEQLEAEHRLECEQTRGWLVLRPDERSLRQSDADAAHLTSLGLPHQILGPDELASAEPALASARPAAGALAAADPGGEHPATGPAAAAAGTTDGHTLSPQHGGGGHRPPTPHLVEPRRPGRGAAPGDPLRCGGALHRHRLHPLAEGPGPAAAPAGRTGLLLDRAAAPARSHARPGPRGAITDAQTGLTLSRMGERVRITDPWADLSPNGRPAIQTQRRMYATLERWFPEAGHGNPAQAWQGTRAKLPDDAPVLGPSPWPGLWLNLGHGDQGSALAGGCAQLLANALEGRPALEGQDLLGCTRW